MRWERLAAEKRTAEGRQPVYFSLGSKLLLLFNREKPVLKAARVVLISGNQLIFLIQPSGRRAPSLPVGLTLALQPVAV